MAYIFRITFPTVPRPLSFEARGRVVRTAFDATQRKIPREMLSPGLIEALSDTLDEFLPHIGRRASFTEETWPGSDGLFTFYCKRVPRA